MMPLKSVIYLTNQKTSQAQLTRKLRVDPARISAVVKYRIDLYTVDKPMDLPKRLDSAFGVRVA